jgi:nucleoporin NUP42
MQTAVRSMRDAIGYILASAQKHPNRIDICKQSADGSTTGEFAVGKRPVSSIAQANPFSANTQTPSPSPFGGNTTPSSGAFGQPSALGQRPNPFGTPSFGQPSQPTSTFGQPSQPTSAFGQPSQPSQPTSAFGQPSQPSQPTSAFGQPSQLGGGASAFGQPSALGQKPSPFGTSAFGQPAQLGAASGGAFGQPSALGQNANPFGAPSSTTNAFSASNNNNPSAANPFSQNNTQNNASPSPFGQQAPASANPFATPGQQTTPAANPFAQAAAQGNQPNNPFGTPAAQQQQQQQPSGFASQSMNNQQTNGFQQAANQNPFQQNTQSPFGQPSAGGGLGLGQTQGGFASQGAQPAGSAGNPYPPGSAKQHPPIESYTSRSMDRRLQAWKGKPVTYKDGVPGIRNFDGKWSRIWFPDGAPAYNKDTELPDEAYDERSKAQWAHFERTATFGEGMPELPPKRESCTWDI